MSDKNRIARDAALACTFIVMHPIRHFVQDQRELEKIFEEIFASAKGAIEAALATFEHQGG
jgi:hypothetical protein